ncbi:MAG TPA: pyruvate dehydrogenase complex dihydrolipoamide acetyltransferase [Myxococcaceae bacterium]|nr:pyruvate dehydrogenase complex dihydrolipoamide acetyltransferase [Myxococcaceae bacterium]
MATEVQLPALSPTMTEGKIVKWLKKEGESISSGEAIAEVETDKSNLEVEAFDDGVLLKILVPEGETGKVGAPIAVIGQKGEKFEASAAPAKAAAPAPAAASAAPTPPAKPAPRPPPPGPEARKEMPQPEERGHRPGGPAQVVPIRRAEEAPSSSEDNGRLRASPLAKRMARDEGLDLSGVQGSGPSGRIVKRDVEAAIGQAGQAAAVAKAPAPAAKGPAPAPVFGRREPDVIAISGMRKIISQRMAEVKPGVPHFYVTVDIDMEEAAKVREQAKAAEVKVSFNDLIVKAAAMALRKQPKVNVSLQGDRILQFHTADVGIAVAIEDGLITPVIRDADLKSLGTIAAEARELAERARRKALKPEEYAGGSITVSNLGMFGVDSFIAVINPPQASIVAVGAVAEKPVVRDGKVVARKMMSATFSGDHRIVDGALGAQYLQELKTLLEQPTRLLF